MGSLFQRKYTRIGQLLTTNQPMLKLVKFLGFSAEINTAVPTQMTVQKDLLTSV